MFQILRNAGYAMGKACAERCLLDKDLQTSNSAKPNPKSIICIAVGLKYQILTVDQELGPKVSGSYKQVQILIWRVVVHLLGRAANILALLLKPSLGGIAFMVMVH